MTDKLKLHQLQPEVFSAEPMWEDFITDLQDTIEEQIRSPIRQLERIRDVGPDSDPVVLSQTLLQLGITFPADIIGHNLHRLRHCTQMLARIHETMGTESAYPTISFVLGRMLEVQQLYTKNYRDFYGRNYESLNIDGGTWYGTTHVDLGMEMVPQDIFMALPEGVTRQRRMLDAYFELAPVNQVIRRFYWILNLAADVNISGTIQREPRRRITKGRGDWGMVAVTVNGPDVVESGQHDVPFFADLQFADKAGGGEEGTSTERQVQRLPLYGMNPIGINSAPEVLSLATEFPDTENRVVTTVNDGRSYGYLCYPIEMGYATFVDRDTQLEGGWDGASWPDSGDIGDAFGPIIITRTIGITSSQWYLYRTDFPAVGTFTFDVTFANPGVVLYSTIIDTTPGDEDAYPGYTIPAMFDSWTTDRPDLVTIDSKGRISFGLVDRDTDVMVSVTAHGVTSSKTVRIRGQQRIESIYIDAPETVIAGEQHEVRVYSVNNGVTTLLPSVYANCIDPAITMVGPTMFVNGANETREVELYAEHRGYKAIAKTTVRFVTSDITLTGIRIQGQQYMYEKSNIALVVIASFSDGSERDIYPYWETSTPMLYVGEQNNVYAGTVVANTQCELTASFQFRGTIMRAKHPMEVRSLNLTMIGLSVQGPIEVSATTRTQFSAVAKWSDGSSSIVTADWSVDRFSIDPETGVLETGSIEDPITLNIRCRSGGRQAQMTINAYSEPVQITSLKIIGPDNVQENIVAQFTALASYSDGTETFISPVWNLKGAEPGTTINADGQFVFSGNVQSGIIEVEAVYSVGGRTYRNTKPIVLIPKVASLSELFISGPVTVEEGQRIQLTATVSYSDGRVETIIPVWTVQSSDPINDPDPAADVFERGIVQGRRVDVDTKVVVVARYFKTVASHVVTVTPMIQRSPDVPVSSRMIGPPVMTAGNVASYAQAIVFEHCAQELLVSSDWTLDVDPSIATIDANGYLYSINGQSLPVTITATYNCGTYIVTDSMVVNIIARQEDISSIVINGPDAVIENSTTPYTLELFRVGQTPIPGEGEIVNGDNVVWEILSGPTGADVIVVDGIGSISILTVPQDTQIVLKATYTEGFGSVTATKVIAVNKSVPVYGTGAIGVRNDQMIRDNLTSALPNINTNQSFTLTVGIGKYGYFAYPASLGLARFIQADNLVEGGWDGAGWPDDGSVGSSTGPLTVARMQNGVITNWYLYRTDASGLGVRTWTVLFGN